MTAQQLVEQKIRNALLRIERKACSEKLDGETRQKIVEDAKILSEDQEFIIQLHRQPFPDEWLMSMIAEAGRPYTDDEHVENRRLFRWIRNARQRAKFMAEKKAAKEAEGMLI